MQKLQRYDDEELNIVVKDFDGIFCKETYYDE